MRTPRTSFDSTTEPSASLVSKNRYLRNRKTIVIEWGDCDPAQIVHFPRYFSFFDACTTALFKKAGLNKRELLKKHGIIGIPMVDVRATFRAPSQFCDEVDVVSEIIQFRRSSFQVRHQLFNRGVLAVECLETRVWSRRSVENSGKIESTPIPQEVIDHFSRGKRAGKPSRERSRRK